MKFTLSWLKDYLNTDADLDAILDTLNRVGLEVEDVSNPADALSPFVIAEVLEAEAHPDADKLRVCKVSDGETVHQIVCGAPNARAGMKAVLGKVGTYVPGADITLGARKVRGVESSGMMCSSRELELGDDHDGIIDLPADAPTGARYVDYAGLDDPIIEIAITPNRQDCLGVYGIARDLAAAGLGTLKTLEIPSIDAKFDSTVQPVVETENCSFFAARSFRGVKNAESPKWLQDRLTAIGQKPISTLVDITNYISISFGRPLHVYDAAKLSGNLTARTATEGEKFTALDDKDYTAKGFETVIADDAGVQGFGGVIGGADSGVSESTTEVVLEVALFDPIATAMTGREHMLITDARYRFERGVDPLFVNDAVALASQMILELVGGEAGSVLTAGETPVWDRPVDFHPERVRTLGGLDLAEGESKRILESLGFTVDDSSTPWRVNVPSWRVDAEGEADLVEEVLRIHGLDNIPSVPLPVVDHKAGDTLSANQKRARASKRTLAARGMSEAVTWSFMSKDLAVMFGGGDDSLVVDNPISSELDCMRPSILANLATAAQRNRDRGALSVELFEVGPVYENDTPKGQRFIAAGLRAFSTGPRHWDKPGVAVDVFDAKADAEAVLAASGAPVDNLMVMRGAPDYFHPGRSGTLRLGPKNILAYFGELHPRVLKAMGIDGPMVGFEVVLDKIPPARKKDTARAPFIANNLQAVGRDFAFVLDADKPAADLVRAIKGADKAHITNVGVFDVYTGDKLEDGKLSLAVNVTLEPKDKTFTDADIEAISAKIIKAAEKSVGAVLRA